MSDEPIVIILFWSRELLLFAALNGRVGKNVLKALITSSKMFFFIFLHFDSIALNIRNSVSECRSQPSERLALMAEAVGKAAKHLQYCMVLREAGLRALLAVVMIQKNQMDRPRFGSQILIDV